MNLSMQMDMHQSQRLILTPQLELSLSILKMGSDELDYLVEEELLSNPLLEVSESYYDQNEKHYTSQNKSDYINSIPDTYISEENLTHFLLTQLNVYKGIIDDEVRSVIRFLIYSLDYRGYLPYKTEQLIELLQKSPDVIESAVRVLRQFEPQGIGAGNIEECLLVQTNDENVEMLIKNHLEDIAHNNITKIEQATGLDVSRIIQCIQDIKGMNPIPSGGYGEKVSQEFIYPDFVVKHKEAGLEIEYIKKKSSYLTINMNCIEWLNQKQIVKYEEDYKKSKLNEAQYLIKSIRQRESTLEKIVLTILERQKKFFEKGKLYLSVLSMKEVANLIEMHESTVSRAISGKYLECKWGSFELKYFFSNKLKQTVDDRNPIIMLQKAIDAEDKKKPLSDANISSLLKTKGINISRRTVSKYREQLRIPSSKARMTW
ncbi:MAG: RNA polymerase sigma-54 factor [Firmicutes bacterium HGW-Firmicutes-3]|jgi:RNA polymerase sigma-54 factor|nr:MAG: RNA polymerase sigma-54 factor [Firmicutes bacterium HGW-Firmicutes-3]